MSKQKAKDDVRRPSVEHANRIAEMVAAELRAQAAVGRAFIALANAASLASEASQRAQEAGAHAAISVGIDINGGERWRWDAAAAGFVRK